MLFITISSFLVCVLHAVMLHTQFNNYVYTSILKIVLFILCPVIYFKLFKDKNYKSIFTVKGDKKYIKRSFILGFCTFSVIFAVFMILSPFLDSTMIVNALAKKRNCQE